MTQAIIAPQLGIWSPVAPATDNPAAQPPRPPQSILARLAVLRAEAFARASEQVRRAPEVWRL